MSYGVFASYYDLLTSNVDYKKYASRVDELVLKCGGCKGKLVDLACGTASLSLELEKLGYEVVGCDISPDMLSQAAQKKYSVNSDIMLIQQDITALSLPGKADVFVCSLDALNHLKNLKAVKSVFVSVAKSLTDNGVFLFDMNTPYKHREILADNVFVYDTDDAFVAWQNDYNPKDDSVGITLDFFVPNDCGLYQRFTEQFTEQAYEQSQIEDLLNSCGLKLVGAYDELSADMPNSNTQRILYCAELDSAKRRK